MHVHDVHFYLEKRRNKYASPVKNTPGHVQNRKKSIDTKTVFSKLVNQYII